MSDLQGKRVVIIGGSSGIGLRVAELAADQGAALVLVGRNRGRLDQAQRQLQTKTTVTHHQVDAHDHSGLRTLFATIGPFDHLVSMVGDVMGGGFLSADLDTIRHVLESKFFTNVLIGQLSAPRLTAGGSLTFTSGTGGRAQHACGSYVGNLGINALVEGLAAELAPRARVNAVSPTWTPTPFWRDVPADQVAATQRQFENDIPLKRTATIGELASAYLFLMQNDFVTGQHLAVDGGIMLGA